LIVIPALAILAVLAGALAGAGLFVSASGGRIMPRVTVAGLRLEGLTRAQARSVLERYDREVVQRPVELGTPGRILVVHPRDFGLGLDVEQTLALAYAVGRRGPVGDRLSDFRRLWSGGLAVSPVFRGDGPALERYLVDLAAELNRPARNARFDPFTGRLTPEEVGREVVLPESLRHLQGVLAAPGARRAELLVRPVTPAVTLKALRRAGVRELLASYSTRFASDDANRVHNLTLAAQALDGTLIPSGGTFSFNLVVGERTEARGYRPAPEIVQERYVLGIGGGTCQVSSTLYNVALLAGLQVTERTAHSQPLGYVPPGRDATVYYGLIDLKVRNNRSYPVAIATRVSRDQLTVALCGQREDFPEVRLELGQLVPVEPGPDEEVPDPSLPAGERQILEEGHTGYRVTLFRRFYRGGQVVGAEQVSEDYYPARPRRVKTGPTGTGSLSKPPRMGVSPAPGVDLSTTLLYN
jgi:vancomycin resistance protein YoaR